MESSSAQPSDTNPVSSGVCQFLTNLPSRGLFSSTVISSNPGGMRDYICDHNTSPPDDQHIKTNQQNILIRSLTLRKQKSDSSSKDGTEVSRKRAAEKVLEGRASAKRTNNQVNSRQEGSTSQTSNRDFQCLTVERLRALLKAKGLSVRGKKDELIARLKGANGLNAICMLRREEYAVNHIQWKRNRLSLPFSFM